MAPLPTPQQRAAPPAPEPAPRVAYSRWRASTTSFGLFGRLVMTVLLLVPVWWFWSVQIFAWPGLVIWVGFLLPWALRDTWRRTRLPQR